MKWIGQHIYDLVSKFRGTNGSSVTIDSNSTSPLEIYQPVVDASPQIKLGSSNTEKLTIRSFYQNATQYLQTAVFQTSTASGVANFGKFQFAVDDTSIVAFLDDGIDLYTGKGISINGTDIITDSSGTATLSNIDALDATTITTLNAALTAGDITGVTAGTGLSGGGTSGAVTLNVDAAQTQITSVGTIGTGVWQGTAIASAYLDVDTAHLSGAQEFAGANSFAQITSAIFDGDKNVTPGDGAVIHVDAHDITDTNTSASGTAAMYTHVNIEGPRLLATNASVTTTAAASLYIKGAPVASTNQTLTNAYALWVDDGLVKFDGALTVGGAITGDVTGDVTGDLTGDASGSSGSCTGQAATVATIAGLAPNTATTQASQPNITTLAGVTSIGAPNMAIGSAAVDQYKAVNNGNPTYSIGSSDTNELIMQALYHSGAQTLETVIFRTETASGTADDGKFLFQVDEFSTLQIDDGGIDFVANHGISIAGTDILTDSSGTATLSNIDALDATTKATINSKSRAYFDFKGYGTADGTNYELPEAMSENKAPFEHDTSTGSDGLTAQTTVVIIRSGGIVMPYTGVLKKFTGWVSSTGTGTVDVGIFKVTPVDNNAGNLTPVLLVNEQVTAAGGTKMRSFSETSSFDAGFTAGDIIYSAVLGGTSAKTWYLNSMLEVEWS